MHKQKLGILLISVIGIAATFMPWASTMGISVSGSKGDGWFSLILFLIPLIISLINMKDSLKTGGMIAVFISSALILGIGVYELNQFKSVSGFSFGMLEIGFGIYVLIFCAIANPVITFLLKDKS